MTRKVLLSLNLAGRLDERGELSQDGVQLIRVVNTLAAFYNGDIPTYADNAAAIAGGLRVGGFYKTSSGAVRIVV